MRRPTKSTSWSSPKPRTTFRSILSAKQIQTVNEVYHAIAVDCIIFRILTHGSTDGTADVALVSQDIVELYAYRSSIPLKEVLRNVCIQISSSVFMLDSVYPLREF